MIYYNTYYKDILYFALFLQRGNGRYFLLDLKYE